MQTNFSRRPRPGFTLVELLTVITIIVLLAGIVVAGYGFVTDRQNTAKAKVQIELLAKAIQEYQSELGSYPGLEANTAAAGDVSEQLFEALFYDGYDYLKQQQPPANWTRATRIYVPDLDPSVTNQGWISARITNGIIPRQLKILDPWGNPYRYRKGTNAQNPDFDIWSVGKDGRTNVQTLNHVDNKDDVRNF